VYPRAHRLVTIEKSRRLNLYCTGNGSPTVILDSGLGDSTKSWGLVQPTISSTTCSCSYDRAGLGFSDPSARPGTSANIVDDLHRLLAASGIQPPYVLVGHSLGGMNVKLYAETYPREVAGLVFVDASHEDMGKAIWKLDPDYQIKYVPYMESLQRCLRASPADFVAGSELAKTCLPASSPRHSDAINAVEAELGKQHARLAAWISEQENVWFASADQVRAAYRRFGDLPLIALTHEPFARTGTETQELRDAKNQVWIRLHNEIAGMSTRGTRRTVEKSGHYIQLDQPEAVSSAILEVVRAVSDRKARILP